MKKLFALVICLFLSSFTIDCWASDNPDNHFLSKPTGEYGVGFQDFHWINKSMCPDPNFNGKNQIDFSSENKNHCHEVMVRIYYPTLKQNNFDTSYYRPFIKAQQETLKQIPGVTKNQIEQLNEIKTYSIEKAPILKQKTFPLIFFSPGFGVSSETYENFITELVSNGYIVVGINSLFISGNIELPNAHVTKPVMTFNTDEILNKYLPIQSNDLIYVYNQIQLHHQLNSLFQTMDLHRIGAFGHSLGAMAVHDDVRKHSNWFKAAVTLDVGVNQNVKKFDIPFMHIVSANYLGMVPITFELGHNNYLVGITPNKHNYDYSYHMNLSDVSTLEYLSAYQSLSTYLKQILAKGYDLKLMSHNPTVEDSNHFYRATYVLVQNNNQWSLSYYEAQNKVMDIPLDNRIKGLDSAIKELPPKSPEKITPSEMKSLQKIISAVFVRTYTQFGTGNGLQITNSINSYLVQFFNTFLKSEDNPAFKNCNQLTKNTFINCGNEST